MGKNRENCGAVGLCGCLSGRVNQNCNIMLISAAFCCIHSEKASENNLIY